MLRPRLSRYAPSSGLCLQDGVCKLKALVRIFAICDYMYGCNGQAVRRGHDP